MKHLNQFIMCNGKVPVAPAGHTIDPHNPANWMSYDQAKTGADMMGWGVGFVFTSSDPYWFVDVDHCREGDGWNQVAQNMMAAFPGAYMEVSQSGEGIHIFGSGQVPEHSCKNKQWGVEFYHEGRFALLNSGLEPERGDPNIDHTANLQWLVNNYFPPGADNTGEPWRTEPVAEWNGPIDDNVLLDKMLKSGGAKAAFGGKATFRDLWEANETVLAQNYPSLNDKDPYDRSSADAALINHLAFWTGKNHERIRQFMLGSSLVRDKWTRHKNYLEISIRNGVSGCRDVYASMMLVTSCDSAMMILSSFSESPDS
jgi:primase-polymerase (primpol)-like protein